MACAVVAATTKATKIRDLVQRSNCVIRTSISVAEKMLALRNALSTNQHVICAMVPIK